MELFRLNSRCLPRHSWSKSETRPYPLPVEQIRKTEYPRLEETTYLDHAGTTIYPKTLIDTFAKDMNSNLFGNPHSQSPSATLSTERVEWTRVRALEFFEADPEHFDLIFVANATAAIKLVVDCMKDYCQDRSDSHFWYGYHTDAHNSLIGAREVSREGSRCFTSDEQVEEWLASKTNHVESEPESQLIANVGLFAYPAQSNMNGRRLPLSWPGRLRCSDKRIHRNVYSLLDAAAFVATAPLDLSDWRNAPDFTALSFYKIFGFPDLGALIVRKESGHVLRKRRYFAGGTVDMVTNGHGPAAWHSKKDPLHERLEDGTLPFHNIVALDSALTVHRKLYGSMSNVSRHTCALAKALYDNLIALAHCNGRPVCRIYEGEHSAYGNSKLQGPTIAMNVIKNDGVWIGKTEFERLAIMNNIQVRTGGMCNPGGIAKFLNWNPEEMKHGYKHGFRCGNDLDIFNDKPTGVVRVSFGAMSSMKDVEVFMRFMQLFVENSHAPTASKSHAPTASKSHAPLNSTPRSSRPPAVTNGYDSKVNVCPVAACSETFGSRVELWEHFAIHQPPKPSIRARPGTRRWRFNKFNSWIEGYL